MDSLILLYNLVHRGSRIVVSLNFLIVSACHLMIINLISQKYVFLKFYFLWVFWLLCF